MTTLYDEIMARTVEGEGGCLLWTGPMDHKTPVYEVRTPRVRAPVRAVLLAGKLRRDLVPSTTCGCDRCIAPEHLIVMTRSRLMKRVRPHLDALHRHKIALAKRATAPKLDLGKAREIRRLRFEGVHPLRVAEQFSISRRMVNLIERGDAWAEPWPGLKGGQ